MRGVALRPDQRYRFVSPEELAEGVGSLEESSFQEPQLAQWRKQFTSIVAGGRWVQSDDSAHCQYALQAVPCMDDPALFTEESRVDYRAFYIIRRRADGAVRVWGDRRRVAADLVEMFRAGATSSDQSTTRR